MSKAKPTSQKILEYIEKRNMASGLELADYLNITPRAVRKQLKKLYERNQIYKVGKPPKVFYQIKMSDSSDQSYSVDQSIEKIINDRYLYISPTGNDLYGWEGFVAWCKKTKQDPQKTAQEYIQTLKKYDSYKSGDVINGKEKFDQTFSHVYIDKLFYLDFYSIERFGKTKLGQLLLYAKQSQDKTLIKKLSQEIQPQISKLINKYQIDGVVFIPPTVRREIQFMTELKKNLHLPIKTIKITKVKTPIIVPQKTLSKLEDRVINAKETFVIEDTGTYSNILIIDDAVGSGATINQTAKKIKERSICQGTIIGLAITGSFKGFDVISEV